ncbi:MAG: polysulfide reductase, partial [Gracilibacter sp. BRH_c7a]
MDIFWGIPSEEHIAWGGMIALYLFLAGIAGGGFLTASLTDLFSKERPTKLIKTGAYIAPVAIIFGLGLLVLDLSKPFFFWKLLININTNSVMSIGTYIISVFVSLAFVYAYLVWAESATTLTGIWAKLVQFSSRFFVLRKPVALLGAIFAICTTTYTGFLLSAITTNTLWSVPFLGLVGVPFLAVLFLVSGVSTGLAATLLGAAKS